MIEVWKEITGYEGYYDVSNCGNVRSLDRIITKSNGVKQLRHGQTMPMREDLDGYWVVRLCRDGVRKTYRVHRLVADAFIPRPPQFTSELEVNHKDLNRKNNFVDNLEWITHEDNILYSIKSGTHISCTDLSGSNNPNYGNRKLSKKYELSPELSKLKQSRPGAKNGRSKPVRVLDFNSELIGEFSYLRECARFLMDSGLLPHKNIDNACNAISKSCQTGNCYHMMYFEYI